MMLTAALISDAEWKIMRVLWRKSPLAAYDISQELAPRENWHQNTIKTLLTRLHKKKAVRVEKYKNLFLYSPLVTEEECVQAASESFLDRIFGGAVQPLLVHFARHKKLSKQDLDELRRILEGKEKRK
jgi:BlaI family transcriptional regulator, penicillinase repressor